MYIAMFTSVLLSLHNYSLLLHILIHHNDLLTLFGSYMMAQNSKQSQNNKSKIKKQNVSQ